MTRLARPPGEPSYFYHEAALESCSESPKYRECLWDDYVWETGVLLLHAKIEPELVTRRSQIEDAATDADSLLRVSPDSIDSYIQAATFLIQCALALGEQGREYYDRAVNVLKKGVESKGHQEAVDLDDRPLNALKDRKDFQRLRQSLKPPVAG